MIFRLTYCFRGTQNAPEIYIEIRQIEQVSSRRARKNWIANEMRARICVIVWKKDTNKWFKKEEQGSGQDLAAISFARTRILAIGWQDDAPM